MFIIYSMNIGGIYFCNLILQFFFFQFKLAKKRNKYCLIFLYSQLKIFLKSNEISSIILSGFFGAVRKEMLFLKWYINNKVYNYRKKWNGLAGICIVLEIK